MVNVRILLARIAARDYTVGIIGLGYVGLPLVLRFGEMGFHTMGFDIDLAKVQQLNSGSSYIHHISTDRVAALVKAGRFSATTDFARLAEADALIICVPTPLNSHREPDMQYVENTADAIARTLRPGQLISLESTTYPGTTDEVLLPRFAARGLTVGEDYFLAFSPEREDPGNARFHTAIIPKVVGGTTPECQELACKLYGEVIERIVPVSSTRVAEATKILENTYRAVNIALVNELKIVFERMGVDVWEVIEASKTKPFGFQAFYPGPGLGGHCIPIDPFYLSWKAREYGVTTRFVELAGEINSAMPAFVVQKVADALNSRGRAVQGARVLVLGVAYKKDIGDIRESPAMEILEMLIARGADVSYSDPFFPKLPVMRRHHIPLESLPLMEASLAEQDVVVVATDHSDFPYELIHRTAPLIVDSRNAMRQRGLAGPHLILA